MIDLKCRRSSDTSSVYIYYILEGIISCLIGYIIFFVTLNVFGSIIMFIVIMYNPTHRLDSVLKRCRNLRDIEKYKEYKK